ncbi:MAG TPA: hypothetical protein VGU71_22160 [Candidatus Dormibacteraeota bacterium]|nr:hypothetical protein [Candidatus Dormibacteraeota bacterium]
MAEILELVDIDALRKEVREKYREVAEDPTARYHFHTGRSHAIRLGYPSTPLDQLPDVACEAFAVIPSIGAVQSRERGLSTSVPEPVWTRSWLLFGWAARDTRSEST